MEVLLIGTGGVGTVIARHLSSSKKVDSLQLADIDIAQAERVATRIGKKKVEPVKLDAANVSEVEDALKGKGLVINSSLPRFNVGIMNAALEAGAKYIDLASTEDMNEQYRFNDAWKKRGNTAILGLGEDPGISNIAAMYAANRLDRVESVRIRDGETANSRKYPFVCLFSPATFIGETMEKPAIFRNGKLNRIDKFSDKEWYDFPGGIGRLPVYSVDHEEVYSLSKTIGKGIKYVDFKLALTDDTLKYLEVMENLGFTSETKIRVGDIEVRPIDVTLKLIPQPAQLGSDITGKAIVLVEVAGRKKGKKVKHVLYAVLDHKYCYRKYGVTATSYLTGTGAAAGALQLLEDDHISPGIYPPEHLNPDRYFEILRDLDVRMVHRTF
ncbi:MAG: saccharopine dehydrogenase NADP-binding domain-containing protein [Candidatus Thermoplasmatota archaeon]|nr:saccharopine dehydrogenase NADP-binding domain-containing protein [Candidatus Sysuiplasma jiujiangense]MBX8642665.1 saccharopine dehydrogenase NADP-binding domain-containing protein [Candidatus Sysuiplasma jiujiangense]MCL4317388.1 saccharopine dehydrogenase NADP-binding domain-containing protein [Candidatus Thermoplasmatota archaeon]